MAWIRIPGLNGEALTAFFNHTTQGNGGVLGLYNTFAGGAVEHCAIGSLGIMPYISATIIIQLLTAVWPTLSKLAREENGRTKIIQYGRYLTVLLCLGQGLFFAIGYEHPAKIFGQGIGRLVLYPDEQLWWYRIQAVLIMTTGTMLLMWLGEQISDRGIGNGVSLVITIGIVARLPRALVAVKDMFWPGGGIKAQYTPFGTGVMLVILLVLVIGGVIAITQAQRKVPVQYAQRAVGRKMYSGGTSFMPLRVNYPAVMPIIFAQSILMFPQTIFLQLGNYVSVPFLKNLFLGIAQRLNSGSVLYIVIYSLMILFFAYFWVATQFNELQIADDLKKNGGYISGRASGTGHERLFAQVHEPHHAGRRDFPHGDSGNPNHIVAPDEHSVRRVRNFSAARAF